jgi:sugar phosphate isomerase/epimerase
MTAAVTRSSVFSRRAFFGRAAAAAAVVLPRRLLAAEGSAAGQRMKLALTPGSIGVRADQREALTLAQRYGFDAVEPNAGFLAGLSADDLSELHGKMQAAGIVFAAAGLPVDFRGDETRFRAGLEALPSLAAGLQRAGVDRVGTWLSPAHNELTYAENMRQHARRLRDVARVLQDHGQRLGLEYVGTPSLRRNRPHPFVHSLRGFQELRSEIGADNVGCVLDSWHWWTAGETDRELLALQAVDVVSVDLNDAPAGIPLEAQQDGQRELPCATGVIPLAAFLNALQRIGYAGPVRAEPFNKALNELDNDAACAAVIAALRKAMTLIG